MKERELPNHWRATSLSEWFVFGNGKPPHFSTWPHALTTTPAKLAFNSAWILSVIILNVIIDIVIMAVAVSVAVAVAVAVPVAFAVAVAVAVGIVVAVAVAAAVVSVVVVVIIFSVIACSTITMLLLLQHF